MVQDSKKEIFKRRNPKTGGGLQGKLKDITDMMLKISPLVWGINGGRES